MARPSWSTSTKIWLSPASPTTRRTAPKNCVLEFRNEKSPRPWGAHGTIAPLFGNAKAVGAPTGTGSWRFVCWMGGEQLDLHLDHVESLQKMCHPDPNPPKEENGRSLLGPGQPLKSPETFRICCDSMKGCKLPTFSRPVRVEDQVRGFASVVGCHLLPTLRDPPDYCWKNFKFKNTSTSSTSSGAPTHFHHTYS